MMDLEEIKKEIKRLMFKEQIIISDPISKIILWPETAQATETGKTHLNQ